MQNIGDDGEEYSHILPFKELIDLIDPKFEETGKRGSGNIIASCFDDNLEETKKKMIELAEQITNQRDAEANEKRKERMKSPAYRKRMIENRKRQIEDAEYSYQLQLKEIEKAKKYLESLRKDLDEFENYKD